MATQRKINSPEAPARRATRGIAARSEAGATTETATAVDHRAIEARAYELYVESGYQSGQELQHWLAAEAELRRRTIRS
jgi:hypothetical protein